MKDSLQPGLIGRLEYVVPAERTVPHLLPESAEFAALPAVLATGFLVGIVEWTCIRALAGHLDEGEQTLGVHVDLSHEAPTPVGSPLTVQAELTSVEGRQLTFTVHAFDDAATVCQGVHRRAVIDTERFLARLSKRATS
ncbi:thioesterase family protein [Actinophytocola sediminis]